MKPQNSPRRVVLRDIADVTGYTVNTVSRALQNKPDIARATCAHIQTVARQMGYIRNSLAGSLRSGSSRTLAAVVGDVSNPFYATMIDAIHDMATEQNYTVLVLCTRDDPVQERNALLTAAGRQVDGVLLCPGAAYRQNIPLLAQARIPCVLMSRREDGDDTDSVVCDEEWGGYLAGRHLLEAGHSKLAYLDAGNVLYAGFRRREGFLRAAREAGLPPQAVHVFADGGPRKTLRTLKRWQSEGVTGLFVFCDLMAWQTMCLLRDNGLADAFSMVGFDNIQAELPIPTALCTVDGNMRSLTRAALALLLRRIGGDDTPPEHQVFPVRLVCRGSCRSDTALPLQTHPNL